MASRTLPQILFRTSPNPHAKAPLRNGVISSGRVRVLTAEELETGLRMLDRADVDSTAFWDMNIASFRQTALFALRETSDALLSPNLTRDLRSELEGQLESLVQYVELANRYVERRACCSGDRQMN